MKTGTSKIKILIVIPCFNEEFSIANLLRELKKINIEGAELCYLPVNDCSKDSTLTEIKNHADHYLDLPVNLGIGGAVQSGLMYAQQNNFDIAVQMDGDGQHPPEELVKVLGPLLKHEANVCIGSRFINKEGFQSSMARRTGISILSALIKLFSGQKIHDCTSGYRAFDKKAIDLCVKYYPDKYPEPESILYLIKNGLKIAETPVIMAAREGGVSSISSFNSLFYMLKVSLSLFFLNLKPNSND